MTPGGLGAMASRQFPRLLSRTFGPLFRMRGGGPSTFLRRRGPTTHTESMLALPADHWERLIRALGLVGNETILDVGCGSGAWLPTLGRLNGRVVAIDTDDDVLDIAREGSRQADNVEIRKMSAESLDFDDGTFDVVTCFTVLPYLTQPASTNEMARVLKPDGTLVLGTVGFGYYAKHVTEGMRTDDVDAIRYGLDPILVTAARAVRGDQVAPASVKSWSPRAVRRLLAGNGFAVDRVVRDVDAVDPSWPKSFIGRPVYFISFATQRLPDDA